MPQRDSAILLIVCPDRKGIVAAISDLLFRHGANILHADQHQDAESGLFLTRVAWDLCDFALDAPAFAAAFTPTAERFDMRWRLEHSTRRPLPCRSALSAPQRRAGLRPAAGREQPP
jgi:formyltetrahydrofolate deformylase